MLTVKYRCPTTSERRSLSRRKAAASLKPRTSALLRRKTCARYETNTREITKEAARPKASQFGHTSPSRLGDVFYSQSTWNSLIQSPKIYSMIWIGLKGRQWAADLHEYIYIYIYIYVHVHMYMHIHIYVCMCISTHTCINIIHTYVYKSVYIYVCINNYIINVYTCMCVYIHIYVDTYVYMYICIYVYRSYSFAFKAIVHPVIYNPGILESSLTMIDHHSGLLHCG